MRVNWFSPLPPSASAAARLTAALLPVVRRWAEAHAFTDQEARDEAIEGAASVTRFDPDRPAWMPINRADLSIFLLADDRSCQAAYRVSRLHRGVVVLCAPAMPRLLERMPAGSAEADALASWMRLCDRRGAEDAAALAEGRATDEIGARYPFHELLTEGALGVLASDVAIASALSLIRPCPIRGAMPPLPDAPAEALRAYSEELQRLARLAEAYRVPSVLAGLRLRADDELGRLMAPSRGNLPRRAQPHVEMMEREADAYLERLRAAFRGLG